MRIALVGPTHPLKGGVAAHTTETARHLARAGHDVVLQSWSRMYPGFLYPGEQEVPTGAGPDVPPFDPVRRDLRWYDPLGWWTAGARLRGYDRVVLVSVVPVLVPALLTIAASVRRGRRARRGGRARVVAIVHNVDPHETHPGGARLIRRLLRTVDAALVHSPDQARLARAAGVRAVVTAALPPHPPGGVPDPAGRAAALARPVPAEGDPVRVLALGIVREYKGFDLLLAAAGEVPGVTVTVAGELWGEAGRRVRARATDPAVRERVRLRPGYVPGEQVPGLLAGHDVLALPYRHATASQNAGLAHAHGLPVLATTVGTFAEHVADGVDGLLVPPSDVPALAAALAELCVPGRLAALRAGLPDLDLEAPWRAYVAAVTSA